MKFILKFFERIYAMDKLMPSKSGVGITSKDQKALFRSFQKRSLDMFMS